MSSLPPRDVAPGSAREAIRFTDTVIARVRSELAARGVDWRTLPIEPTEETRRAARVADEWDRAVEDLIAERRGAEAGQHFRERWPALVRWRDRTLANWRRERAADVAAAYELVALECFLGGAPELGERAQAEAIRVVMLPSQQPGRGRRSA